MSEHNLVFTSILKIFFRLNIESLGCSPLKFAQVVPNKATIEKIYHASELSQSSHDSQSPVHSNLHNKRFNREQLVFARPVRRRRTHNGDVFHTNSVNLQFAPRSQSDVYSYSAQAPSVSRLLSPIVHSPLDRIRLSWLHSF